ncbi:uncharacterized protein Z518_11053 [Rhinocladiella mackenziei CBS 650.93]|uniref:Uncharacterized protein n=1 Tax=Rhinocladiella mackenziei CBS 650.93 TaxID=1442369 RepID=A0A0D2I8S7_9EURO|nr:uncharacterized protein Z518_11053 [Rhinocladiella mackenziei CBS 650.93]KIW99640.1 hypothetical protein Z518_11053 [Rhinocladiella mackenziei CBS 650.93]
MNRGEPQDNIVTPPLSYRNSPLLTPPPTDEKIPTVVHRITSAIERYKRGQDVPERRLLRFRIDEPQHRELERQLFKDEFCRIKLRCDYFPLQRLFIIRMPSRIHERFLIKVHDEIRHQLRSVEEGPSSEFAQGIDFEGSATFIPSDSEYGRHDPDGSFRHAKELFPGLVTEAAYSQEGKMLRDLADDYILGSDLRVRALAAFDISYKKKTATVSVWRPQLLQEDNGEVWTTTSEVQVFRNDNGESNLDAHSGLRIHLRDFASVEFCEMFGNIEGSIFISCATLCTFLDDAESDIDVKPVVTARPVLRKRRRTPTPEEELDTDDERDMIKAEERAAKRADRDDSSFKDSSSITSGNG